MTGENKERCIMCLNGNSIINGGYIMIGALIGDIVGSRFERHNIKTKEFELFDDYCKATDDSVMTLALAAAILYS